jgi:lipopolysaccharide transport system ATP-binding protein
MRPIITIEHLSKQYQIGTRTGQGGAVRYVTLRESLVEAVRAPWRRLRGTTRLTEETIWALNDVSFSVMPGEVIGIIGRSGSGKSTLLKILSRVTEPTSGRAELYGRVTSLLEVGTGFHPDLTGRENIYLNGAILGMKRREIERKFDEIVAFAEIERFLETPVKHYSSGMYLRLAFAVGAHLNPDILIIDEVLAVGDASFQLKCLGKMDEVTRDGRTVVLVSHDMTTIVQTCHTAVFLQDGQVDRIGPAKEVVAHYWDTVLPSPLDGNRQAVAP